MSTSPSDRRVILVAGGQGSQFLGMGHDHYTHDSRFRAIIDEVLPTDIPRLAAIRQAWIDRDDASLSDAAHVQTLLIALTFAGARLLHDMGVEPDGMLGHSAGEFALACSSGLIDDGTLAHLLDQRAEFLGSLAAVGTMAAIRASETTVEGLIRQSGQRVFIAGVNSPNQCVVGGTSDAIAAFCEYARSQSTLAVPARSNLPFHTPLMRQPATAYTSTLNGYALHPLRRPLFSTVTTAWLTDEEARSPEFWASQLCRPVRFWDSVEQVLQETDCVFVDLGPGTSLSAVLASHPALRSGNSDVIPLMPMRGAEASHAQWRRRTEALRHRLARPQDDGTKSSRCFGNTPTSRGES